MPRKPSTPTPTQEKALRLALDGGALRRLPGGFWTNAKHPDIRHGEVPAGEHVEIQTLRACARRGWLSLIEGPRGYHVRAEILPAGYAAIGEAAPASDEEGQPAESAATRRPRLRVW